MKHVSVCPGCRVQLESDSAEVDEKANASQGCLELYSTLAYYTLSLQDSFFIHQLAVDAYAAQHHGRKVKPIRTTFALVGLYLVNERGYTGRQVQRVHMALAKKSKVWPQFPVPAEKASLTVQDVVQAPAEIKQEMIKRWHAAVWEVWKPERGTIAGLLKEHLNLS